MFLDSKNRLKGYICLLLGPLNNIYKQISHQTALNSDLFFLIQYRKVNDGQIETKTENI